MDCWHRYEHTSSNCHANVFQFSSIVNEDQDQSTLSASSTLDDPLWYLDSGASHHVRNDLNNFFTKAFYHGNDIVKIGNGSGMSIKHIGNVCFTIPHTNTGLYLNKLSSRRIRQVVDV